MDPNVFRIGVEEKVSVTVFDAGKPVTVKVYLQDYPHRRRNFSEVQAVLSSQPGDIRQLCNVIIMAATASTKFIICVLAYFMFKYINTMNFA